jgi:uncharacterized protein YyaL (SSP411 family)
MCCGWRLCLLTVGVVLSACARQEEVLPESPQPSVVHTGQKVTADADSGVSWRAWSAASFAEARQLQRPVLLYTSRIGCGGLFSGADPLARWQAETRYIPVRIDPQRHPDVARRYAPAGCPSLSILLATGEEVVRATDMARDNVPLLLSRIHEHLQKRPAVVDKEMKDARQPMSRHTLTVKAVRAAAVSAYDTLYGGFGGPYKFPETQVLAFLQELGQRPDGDNAAQMVQRTLDGLLVSPVWQGGIGSMSHTPDWQTPRYEAYAADQAGLLIVLGRAAAGSANYRRAGQQLFDAISADWFNAEAGAYYSRRLAGTVDQAGWMDPVVQADANALLIRACLQVATPLDRLQPARRQAEAAGDALLGLLTADGAVRHTLTEDAPIGLLRDQMLVALAFDELVAHTERDDFAVAAQQVRSWADAHLWDGTSGQFADAPARTWPQSWAELPDDRDDRGVSGMAAAVEAVAAAGDAARALQMLQQASLRVAPDRAHAGLARQALILAGSQ